MNVKRKLLNMKNGELRDLQPVFLNIEAAEMISSGLDPGLGCRGVLSGIGIQQNPFAPSQVGIQGRLLQRCPIAKPKTEAMAVGKSSFRDRTTNPTTCTTNQESAHGYQLEGLQR